MQLGWKARQSAPWEHSLPKAGEHSLPKLGGLSRPDRGRWGGVWGPGMPGQACTGGKEAELNRFSEASVLGSAAHLWG